MTEQETELRHQMVRLCKSLFDRGFSVGSAGNVSAKLPDGILMTPTNSTLGSLEADRISKVDTSGKHVSGDRPSKEVFLHQAFYETRPQAGAVVHLHSTWATALSCLADTDPDDCIPPLTPYVVMRVGRVKLLPYVKPGDPKMGDMIRDLKGDFSAALLANHGPVVSGKDLFSAVCAAEELEETAKLLIALEGRKTRLLTPDQVTELNNTFKGL
ncbi:3-oxo-tetronate 4-phosphate decarboxylase [Sulfitobacter geojensis]|uniref:3-oxo-tetronate 4-phosphate decarboxylase n=1 Tax=Sulfitobacter geojensis TaxID=1342299 RepID=UPI00046A43A7|nr:3-oxo-tetronate 4-phosphate decarboxylase [Sulfitobacter geojensis]KHA51425.1 L-fuculose-phosphate aldolase [Sulfitobacter geojensis]NYI30360.1 ribulose-5-phosphate 4-epimerase/fuculose-1-phosphate aldolase [Sulfitobacter geojensis]